MGGVDFPVEMRTAPSLIFPTGTDFYDYYKVGTRVTFDGGFFVNLSGKTGTGLYNNALPSTPTNGQGIIMRTAAGGSISFSAEL